MTRLTRQITLTFYAIGSATILVVAILNPALLRDGRRPGPFDAKTRWLASHPADWAAASEVSDAALDSASPRRFQLWYAAYAHAQQLAPHRANTSVAFVRGGLFHWYELGPEDRRRVLEAAGPLMKDPGFFGRMYTPLWQLTRNFAWLRRVAPDTLEARQWLRDLAIVGGLFADYRVLREEIRRERMEVFLSRRATADMATLMDLVPERLDTADEALARGILEELERRPVDVSKLRSIEKVVELAVRHDLQPLSGIEPLVTKDGLLRDVTRARAALAMNKPSIATQIELTSAAAGSPEWSEYFGDRARFEARRGESASAEAYLLRAAHSEPSLAVLAAGEELANAAGQTTVAASYRKQLEARARLPRAWFGTCGTELCTAAQTTEYFLGNRTRLELATTQSDETSPYVEIFIDDTLVAEGEVGEQRVFEIPASPGLHRLEVRLVNPRTRNGAQRRIRLS